MTEPGGRRRPIDLSAEMAGLWTPSGSAGTAAPPQPAPPRPASPRAPRPAPPPGAGGPPPPTGRASGTVPPAPAPPQPEGPERRLTFHGTGGALFGIWVVNVLLTLLTLGIYYFWGKVRVRRYFASQTEIESDRFAFHGTGRELLVGTAKAALLFAVPFALFRVVPELDLGLWLTVAAVVLAYASLALLIPLAMVGARRYRMSRTSWRGIRFAFRGRSVDFIRLFVRDSLLTVLTLGLYYPVFATHIYDFMVSRTSLGSERFGFDGRPRDLFRIYGLAFLLWLPTLGLYYFWFRARKQRYLWAHTTFGAARFASTVTGGKLCGLLLVNLLLLVGTLGIAWPWVAVRNARFAFRYLALVGPLDLARVEQRPDAAGTTGEGLAGLLDTGFELDV
jgi:uncharacterized membrane protein YjgN (DUF898 family)